MLAHRGGTGTDLNLVIAVLDTIVPTVPNSPSAAAVEAWQTIRSSRMAIHARIVGAAIQRDASCLVGEVSRSYELLAHRSEAIRLIKDEISALGKHGKPSDALIIAVSGLGPSLGRASSQSQIKDKANKNPFRLRLMPKGWEGIFVNVMLNPEHHNGLFALVARKGGTAALSHPIARIITIHDALGAATELRAPWQPFVHDKEVAHLISDPSINVVESDLELQTECTPGSSLPELQRILGISSALASVLTNLQRAMMAANALTEGTLRNINIQVLLNNSAALHHAILSAPSASRFDDLLYEPVRLATLIFDVGIVFPQPVAMGALSRVVRWMKAALEITGMEHIRNKEVLIWILFVGGVAAREMTERAWFVERLNGMLGDMEWAEVKRLLRSFVWMPDAMDEGAIGLWDDMRCCERV